jgi:hypothetical protein
VQQDDEFDKVGVGLLPERFLPSPEEVVEERSNVVRERVGVEVILEGIVSVLGAEADFDVVLNAVVPFKDVVYPRTKITFECRLPSSLRGTPFALWGQPLRRSQGPGDVHMALDPHSGRLAGNGRGHNPFSGASTPRIPFRGDTTSNETGSSVGRRTGDADSAARPAEVALRISGLARLLSFPGHPSRVVPADRPDRDKDQDGRRRAYGDTNWSAQFISSNSERSMPAGGAN